MFPTSPLADRYELTSILALGGMGTIYRATDRQTGGLVAVKVMHERYRTKKSAAERFAFEARLGAMFDHPNLIPITDYVLPEEGGPAYVMPLLEGPNLMQRLHDAGPMDVATAAKWIAQIASGLQAMHKKQVVHRDLKPENVLITSDDDFEERAVLIDYGLAFFLPGGRRTTRGTLVGSVPYVAPECADGSRPTTGTDIYALGVLAFELLTGAPPFEGRAMPTLFKKTKLPAPSLARAAADRGLAPFPPAVVAAVDAALDRDLRVRPNTVTAFAQALTRAAEPPRAAVG